MQPIEELRYLIFAAQQEGSWLFAEALRPLCLTLSQVEMLRALQDYEPLSLIALGNQLACEAGSSSRLVQGLVEDSLVERLPSSTDKRMVTLTLTDGGRQQPRQRKISAYTYRVLSRPLMKSGTFCSNKVVR